MITVLAVPSALIAGQIPEFDSPVKVKAGGEEVAVEAPGYAAPCVANVDGDGVEDLLVGQFRGGKISFYKGSRDEFGSLSFAKHQWLMAGDEPAAVPGVW